MAMGDSNRIFSPSLNSLNLSMKPSNMMTTSSRGPVTELRSHTPATDNIWIAEEPFDVSDISTPSMMVVSVKAWWTSSDVGMLHSDEPR